MNSSGKLVLIIIVLALIGCAGYKFSIVPVELQSPAGSQIREDGSKR